MTKIVLILIALTLSACTDYKEPLPSSTIQLSNEPIVSFAPQTNINLKLVAVGDNLIHGAVYKAATLGEDDYDFKLFYLPMISYIEQSDIAYVNLETLAAGSAYGLSNYPNFNGPTQIIDDLIAIGFNWLALSSNHSLDKGVNALMDEYDYIHGNYDVITTGVHLAINDADYVIKTINGIKVGFLGYTYGLNGHTLPSDYSYLVDLIDQEAIVNDLNELSELSDIQLVSIHWGSEYQIQPNDQQLQLAQLMCENGADVIIGTHPHVIQPMQVLTQPNGCKTVVVYSLGNFISAQDKMQCMLEAMLSLELSYDVTNGEHSFKRINMIPLINQIENSFSKFKIILLRDYLPNDLNKHTLNDGSYSLDYFYNLWNQVYPNHGVNFE